MNKNIDNNILMKKEELLERINELSIYYTEDTTNYLKSLLYLNESVFKNSYFSNLFSDFSFPFEIAKYNIYNRTISTIFSLSPILSKEFVVDPSNKGIKIFYQDKFPVFDFMSKKQKGHTGEKIGPLITIYSVNSSVKDRIENIKSQIADLEEFGYKKISSKENSSKNEYNNYDKNGKKLYMSKELTPLKVSIYESRIKELNEKIEFLKSYGNIQRSICTSVTDALFQDWNMTFKDDEYVKTLSWIDIYRKKI